MGSLTMVSVEQHPQAETTYLNTPALFKLSPEGQIN